MKILDELRSAKGFDTLIATTFGIDLPWFESLLLRQLRRQGVKKFLVFGDANELAQALEDNSDKLVNSGNSYVLQSVYQNGSFHPKIYLLIGEKDARLYVGSGNMNRSGLGKNLEIFERWDLSLNSELLPQPFDSAKNYIYKILLELIPYLPSIVSQIVNDSFNRSIFEKPKDTAISEQLWCSPGSFFSRLEPVSSPCQRLVFVSPYFDKMGKMVIDIAHHFKANEFDVITDVRKTNITPEAVRNIADAGGKVFKLDPKHHPRHMHAKMIYTQGVDWAFASLGSANASIAAWQGINAEAIVTRSGSGAGKVAELIDSLQIKLLSESDISKLVYKDEENSDSDNLEIEICPRIIFAEWISQKNIQIVAQFSTSELEAIEVFGSKTWSVKSFSVEDIGKKLSKISFSCPELKKPGQVTTIRLVNQITSSPLAVVHDVEEIRIQASRTTKEWEYLEQLLGSDQFDPDGAERLLLLFSTIQRKRFDAVIQKRTNLKLGDTNKKEEDKEVQLFVTTERTDFESSVQESQDGNNSHSFSSTLSSHLMNRLLFGGTNSVSSDVENESESEDNDESRTKEKERGSTIKCSQKQRESFLESARKAREQYLGHLKNYSSRNLYLLLDDLQILTAPLHYMYRGGGLSASAFRGEMVEILRALLGSAEAPLLMEIANYEVEERRALLEKTPILHLATLLIYNTCLAHCEASHNGKFSNSHLTDAKPVLWLWHFVRLIPDILNFIRSEEFGRQIYKLRLGAFWLADCFKNCEQDLPFVEFVKEMIRASILLDKIDKEFDGTFGPLRGKGDFEKAEDSDEPTVIRTYPGSLGIGWTEEDVVLVADGAFQNAIGKGFWQKMRKISTNNAVPISLLYDQAVKIKDEEINSGLIYLESISR